MASPILVISHYIFLTREQRYILNIPEAEIDVVGYCSPVWLHNGEHITPIAEEVFAKYRFRHCPEPEKQTINLVPEGFFVRLSPDMPKFLLDFQDDGQMNLNLTHKNAIIFNDKVTPITHFLNVDDMTVLEGTLC